MISPKDVLILLAIQRSGSHMLGAAIGSHSQMKYTGEIFNGRHPSSWNAVLSGIDRCRSPGKIVCVDVKYNQMTSALEEFASQCHGVIHLLRKDLLALYFSGELHTYRGEYPEAWESGEIPTFTFNKSRFREITQARREWIAKYAHLENLRLVYEDLTGGREINQLPEWAGRQICALAGVEYEPLIVDFGKDAPADYMAHLIFPNGVTGR